MIAYFVLSGERVDFSHRFCFQRRYLRCKDSCGADSHAKNDESRAHFGDDIPNIVVDAFIDESLICESKAEPETATFGDNFGKIRGLEVLEFVAKEKMRQSVFLKFVALPF